jgi:hypothetical protein
MTPVVVSSGAADDLREQIAPSIVQDRHEIGAVIQGDRRPAGQDPLEILGALSCIFAADRVRRNPEIGVERGGHVVLRGLRVARAERHLRAGGAEGPEKGGGLRRGMKARGDAVPAKRALAREPLAHAPQDRHAPLGPSDATVALGRAHGAYAPTVDRIAWACFVPSHVNPGSLRPKCP